MSVDRLKRDFLSAAQKYKKLFKENANPDDLDSFKRLMDAYIHLDDIADDEIQDLQSVTDEGNTTTNSVTVGSLDVDAGSGTARIDLTTTASFGRYFKLQTSGSHAIIDAQDSLKLQADGGDTEIHLFPAGQDYISFSTKSTERMRINQPGNLLIGTTTDSGEKLQVAGNIKIIGNDQRIYGPSNTEYIRFYTPGNFLILKGQNGVRIDGNLRAGGLYESDGTSAFVFYPNYDGIDKVTRFYNTFVHEDSTDPFAISRGDLEFRIDSNNDSTTSAFKITKDAGTELMRINEDGNVGIGTSSPSQKLHVDGTVYAVNGFKVSNGYSIGAIGYNSALRFNNDNILFNNSSGNEAVRFVASTGNLLIGTTTDAGYKLDVSGSTRTTGTFISGNAALQGGLGFAAKHSYSTFENGSNHITFNPGKGIFFSGSTFQLIGQGYSNRGGTSGDVQKFVFGYGSGTNKGDLTLGQVFAGNYYGGHGTQMKSFSSEITNSDNNVSFYSDITPESGSSSWHFRGLDSGVLNSYIDYEGNYFGTSYAISGGTSSQFLKADGSVDSTAYLSTTPTLDEVTTAGSSTTNSISVSTMTSSKTEVDFTPTSDTIALDIRGTGTPNDYFTVSNATGGANDVFLPVFFYKAATYGYNGGTNRYPSGVYGGGFIAAVDDTSYPSSTGAGAAMHFNSRAYANNGPLSNRYLFSWGSWLTTHMAMTAGGNLLIGKTTDSGEELQVDGSADVSGDINADGDFYQNGAQGWSGTINIPTNPPVTITVQGGIITNVT